MALGLVKALRGNLLVRRSSFRVSAPLIFNVPCEDLLRNSSCVLRDFGLRGRRKSRAYIMPPMSGMPAPAGSSFFGLPATIALVVI